MRYLNDTSADSTLITTQSQQELNQEMKELGDRITANSNSIEQLQQQLDEHKEETVITKQQGNFDALYVQEANADTLHTNSLNAPEATITTIENDTLNTHDITATDIDTSTLTADDINAGSVDSATVNTHNLDADHITTDTIAAGTGSFNELTIDNATIAMFKIDDVDTQTLTTETLTATEADIQTIKNDTITTNLIESDAALLQQMQTHNIIYDDSLQLPYYIDIEPGTFPTADQYRIVEVPFFDTGDYYLNLKDPVTGYCWWSVIVHNNHNNLTVSYSRRTTDRAGMDLSVPTLSEMYVWNYFSEGPKLYLKTFVGGHLYWQNQSLNLEQPPATYNEWPFDTMQFGALHYLCLHDGATWFTKHIDLIRNQSLDNASLFIIPSDWNNAEKRQIEYNGLVDIPWKFYSPNQSLDTTDEVTFRNIIINPLDGKWVYNHENALMGKNPELIGEDNQLDPHQNLIETEELAKWNGKVGTAAENHEVVAGTIFREQGYTQTSTRVFERRDPDSYDYVEWSNRQTRTDLVSLRRKSDWAIILSNPPIMGTYEDEEQETWTEYRFLYPEVGEGKAYESWIERELPDGSLVSRLLESTVDSSLYINYTRFKEEFPFGDINYNVYSYENYSNPLRYLGNVVEGTWDAGEIHATKKSNPSNSAEPDYTGNLIVDGTTNLRNNVTILNNYDSDDVKNVETVDIHSDATTLDGSTLDITLDTSRTAAITGTDTTAVVGDKIITVSNDASLSVGGDYTAEVDGNTLITAKGDINASIGSVDPITEKHTDILIDSVSNVTVREDGNIDARVNGTVSADIRGDVSTTVGTEENPANSTTVVYGDETSMVYGDGDRRLFGDYTMRTDKNLKILYGLLELIGHKQDEDGKDIPGYHTLIRDDVEIGQADDRHNLFVHGQLKVDSMAFSGDEGDNMRIRNVGTEEEPDMVAVSEHCATVDDDGTLVPEDKLITADKLGLYNGTTNPHSKDDPLYTDLDNAYPLTELGDEARVHGDLTVEETAQIDGDTTIGTDDAAANLVVHGNADIDNDLTARVAIIHDKLTTEDLYVKDNAVFDKTVSIRGDLVIDGSVIATDEKTIETSSDYVVLRQSKQDGLSATEHSGMVIHNYDGNGKTATIAVDNTGTWRVADNAAENTTSYSDISFYDDSYYDGFDQTAETAIVKGIATSIDTDILDDVVYYNGKYYHFNEEWYELTLLDDKVHYDEDSPIADESTVEALNGLDKKQFTYYRNLTILQIDDTTNQPLLTRSEANDMVDKVPLMWDSENSKAVPMTSTAPIKNKQTIVSKVTTDEETGEKTVSYEWGKGGGGGAGAVLALTQAEYDERVLIEDMDDDNYIPNNAMIVITDADEEYLHGDRV